MGKYICLRGLMFSSWRKTLASLLSSLQKKQLSQRTRLPMRKKAKLTTQFTQKKVAIVGGGISGLFSLKTMLEDGHQAILYEKSDQVGGVWSYQQKKRGGVWKSAYASSSKTFMHPSDFPFPDEVPIFPHHTHVFNHIKSYANHFDLWPCIHLNHEISHVTKIGQKWLITLNNTTQSIQEVFDAIVICGGQNSQPSYPQEAIYSRFTGKTMHSHDYKFPTEAMEGKHILVIGGGESASDIADEVSNKAKSVHMSIRNGQWFLSRHTGGRLAFDTRFARKSRIMATNYGNNPVVKLYELMYATSNGEGGHGINEWRPTVPLMNEFINKSRFVLDKIVRGQVIPQKGVKDIQGNHVWFEGHCQPIHIDMIIFATGYKRTIDYLDFDLHGHLYKNVFEPNESTLAFVGNIRPVFGSITALAELQARWVSLVFGERCQIPSTQEMKHEIEKDMIRHKKIFPSKHERLPQLVSHFEYADYIVRQIGARPNYLKLFFQDNKKWRVLLNAPWTPFETLITHPTKGEDAYQNLLNEYAFRRNIIGPSLFKLMVFVMLTTLLSGIFLSYGLVALISRLFGFVQ
ncbi:MAG: NAD(P)-binding domain-containing protein [Chloroflexota bacterium]